MKNLLVLSALFILLLPLAYSQTSVFSGTVITDKDNMIDGNNFRFTYDSSSNKVFVQMPVSNLIIENGKCKSNGAYKVCISSADYYDVNVTTYVYSYKIGTTITKLTGSIATSSSASIPTLLQGESTNITIQITNPTSTDVANIKYAENLTGFFITNVNGCTLDGDAISWSGSLKSQYHQICTATISTIRQGAYSFVGSLSYFNGFDYQTSPTDTLSITVLPDQLAMSKFVDSNVESYQPFYLNSTIQNINPTEYMDVTIKINIPNNFMLLNKVAGFSKNDYLLESETKLQPGESFSYPLYLEANSGSKIPIKQAFDYQIKGLPFTMENNTFIEAPEPKPVIALSSDNELVPGQDFLVSASLRNPSMLHELKDIRATLHAPYNKDILKIIDSIAPNQEYPIINNALTLPKSAEQELSGNPLILNLTVEYKFREFSRLSNSLLEIRLKQQNINSSNVLNATSAKANLSTPSSVNPRETNASVQSIPTHQANQTASPAAMISEKPKHNSFKQILLFIGIALAAFLAVLFIIIRIRKGKKEAPEAKAEPPKEEAQDTQKQASQTEAQPNESARVDKIIEQIENIEFSDVMNIRRKAQPKKRKRSK